LEALLHDFAGVRRPAQPRIARLGLTNSPAASLFSLKDFSVKPSLLRIKGGGRAYRTLARRFENLQSGELGIPSRAANQSPERSYH
jgi:hypothetical protein